MPIYGFGRDHASNLTRVARREGLRKTHGGLAKYPDAPELIQRVFYAKPSSSYSVGATNATVTVWKPDFSGAADPAETVEDVIINVRNVTTSTKLVCNTVDGITNAFPKDCTDS